MQQLFDNVLVDKRIAEATNIIVQLVLFRGLFDLDEITINELIDFIQPAYLFDELERTVLFRLLANRYMWS